MYKTGKQERPLAYSGEPGTGVAPGPPRVPPGTMRRCGKEGGGGPRRRVSQGAEIRRGCREAERHPVTPLRNEEQKETFVWGGEQVTEQSDPRPSA